jgi:ABC-type multidrug transport system fused ATPase/permease subunit
MKHILKKLNALLDKKQKRTMVGLMFLMVLGALLQTAGVGMLVQVVTVVIDPQAVEKSGLIKTVYDFFGFTEYAVFSSLVMLALVIVFAVKNTFLYVQQKLTLAFVYTNQFRTSERMMRNYMRRGYEFYLNADTAVVQRNITSDVNNMYGLVLALLQLMSDGVLSVFIVTYCLSQSGSMTILLAVAMLFMMVLVKKVLKPIMYKAGKDNQDYYSQLFKWIAQSIQGIKEVKVSCKEQFFVNEYKKCGKGYVEAVQKYSLYNNIPKLLLETVCVGVMMAYMMVQALSGESIQDMVANLSTIAAAAFVLLPSVNRINNQINSISYFEPFLMGVSDNLQDEISDEKSDMTFASKEASKLPVKDCIELKEITYAYPNTEKLIFEDASMKIPVGSAVGIVGTSGAGKSTIVDILLGLLEPKSGAVYADGVDIKENYRSWLKNVGYIPQMIFMLDDTIRKNVAFGVPEDEIDEERIWAVLKEARLDEFVKSLPEGLETGIGERGIRLSGGQRQRIGIARALYHDPEVLVLDEATSALDNDTEKAIMESINSLHGRKTLIIIAHRLQTIENCDMVYRVQDGKIV